MISVRHSMLSADLVLFVVLPCFQVVRTVLPAQNADLNILIEGTDIEADAYHETLVLDERDSGQNGFWVNWFGYGEMVRHWVLVCIRSFHCSLRVAASCGGEKRGRRGKEGGKGRRDLPIDGLLLLCTLFFAFVFMLLLCFALGVSHDLRWSYFARGHMDASRCETQCVACAVAC
jgi:hypothetical protein